RARAHRNTCNPIPASLRPHATACRQKTNGAEEGTRTPTPLRAHGPEPCASASSATSAFGRKTAACATAFRRNYSSILPHRPRVGKSAKCRGMPGEGARITSFLFHGAGRLRGLRFGGGAFVLAFLRVLFPSACTATSSRLPARRLAR